MRNFTGVKQIANFLRVHERTVYRHLRVGRLPVKKNNLGRWTLWEEDYLRSLRPINGYYKSTE
jgi:predicted site-specific integrase-resolvase